MREILFKAKRIDNGEWVEGYIVKSRENTYSNGFEMITKDGINYDDLDYFVPDFISHKVDTNTLCQYTGLTDKNGNKIWENDVVKYHFGNDAAPIRFGEYQNCFDNTKTGHIGFYVDWDCKKALRKDLGYWVNMIDCNVVGNIFDNPELLEGGAK